MLTGTLKVKDLEVKEESLIYTVFNNYNKILLLTPLFNIYKKDIIILTNFLNPFENKIICKLNTYTVNYYEELNIINGKKTANNSQDFYKIYHKNEEIVNFITYEQKKNRIPVRSGHKIPSLFE